MPLERLQKILAAAEIASRRASETLMREGRVTVNGTVVTELGTKADASSDHIKVDGKLLRPAQHLRYILMNKPRGVLVTRDDPSNRVTVFTLLGTRVKERLVPVGRLDTDSEGLLILTNDGTLVHSLTHPSGGCLKTYEVKVSGVPSQGDIEKLRSGVYLDDGKRTAPASVTLQKTTPEKEGLGGNAWLEVIVGEGRYHQVRRMFETIGHPVSKLRRVAIGPLRDRLLKPGMFREMTPEEVEGLKKGPKEPAPGKPGMRTPRKTNPHRERADLTPASGSAFGSPSPAPRGRGGRGVRSGGEAANPAGRMKRSHAASETDSPKRNPRGGGPR